MPGGVTGGAPNAEHCVRMLERGALQQLWPLEVLRIGDFVTAQLAEINALQERLMLPQAAELERQMIECFPRWAAALELLGALAARSERLRANWLPSAVPRLVQLIRLGVDPGLKAKALRALGAFVSGTSAAAAAEAAALVWEQLCAHSEMTVPVLPPVGSVQMPGSMATAGLVIGSASAASLDGCVYNDDFGGKAIHGGDVEGTSAHADADVCAPLQPTVLPHAQLLIGLQEDFVVEGRHQRYPQTQAFLRLLGRIVRASAAAGLPPPCGAGDYVAWAAEGLFAHFDSFGYRDEDEKWAFATSCLSLLHEVLLGYDPALCDAQDVADMDQPTTVSHMELSRWLLVDGRPPVPQGVDTTVSTTPLAYAGTPPIDGLRPMSVGTSDITGIADSRCGVLGNSAATIAATAAPPEHRLPELPPGLKLLSAFSLPRSPLLHRLLWLLVHASARLAPLARGAMHFAHTSMPCAVQLYRAASLGMQLLQLLLIREPALHAKLVRMFAAQKHVTSWACWRPAQREALRTLHADLRRSLPAASAIALPQALTERLRLCKIDAHLGLALTTDARTTRLSALAATWLLLHASVRDQPRRCAEPLMLSALSVLRYARAQLGADFVTPLRAEEGVLSAARSASLLLLEPLGTNEASKSDSAGCDDDAPDPWDAEALELAVGAPTFVGRGASQRPAVAPALEALASCDKMRLSDPVGACSSPACQLLLLLLDELQRAAPAPACHRVLAPSLTMLLELEAEPRSSEVDGSSLLFSLLQLCRQTADASAATAVPLATLAELVLELLFRLGSHLRFGDAVLRAAHKCASLPRWLISLPRQLSQLEEIYAAQVGRGELAATPSAQSVLWARLHAIGHGLKLVSASLVASVRPPAAAGGVGGSCVTIASMSAEPVLEALLSTPIVPTEMAPCDELAPVAAAEPLFYELLRMLLSVARLAIGDTSDEAIAWKLDAVTEASQWRGEGFLALCDVRAFSVELDAAGIGDAERQAALSSALSLNTRLQTLHGLLHVLSSLRQLTSLLLFSCGPSECRFPRLNALLSLLELLATLPAPLAPLAPSLCSCARAFLCKLGTCALVQATDQLRVLQLTLCALTRLQLPGACRTEMHMLLIAVLRLAKPPSTFCWQHSQQHQLAHQTINALCTSATKGAVTGDGATFVQLLALDARDGTPRQQIVALAALKTLLLLECDDAEVDLTAPVEEANCLTLLCRGALLPQLLSPPCQSLAAAECPIGQLPPKPLDAALYEARRSLALRHCEATLALLLHILLRLGRAAPARVVPLVVAMHDSGTLRMLTATPDPSLSFLHLDVGSFCGNGKLDCGVGGSSALFSMPQLHAKLTLPMVRVMNAAALSAEPVSQHFCPLLAHFLAGSPLRLRTMRQLLTAAAQPPSGTSLPMQLLKMSHDLVSLLNAGWKSLAQLECAESASALSDTGARCAFLGSILQLIPALAAQLPATQVRFRSKSGTFLGALVSMLGGAGGLMADAVSGSLRLEIYAVERISAVAAGSAAHDEASAVEVEELLSQLLSLCCRCCELTATTDGDDVVLRGGPLAADPLPAGLLFSPVLSDDAGPLPGSAPSLGVLAQLICWTNAQLRSCELQHMQLEQLHEQLLANTSEQLRQLCAHIAEVLPTAEVPRTGESNAHLTSVRKSEYPLVTLSLSSLEP